MLRDRQDDYWWRLTVHLAPYFNELRLDEITFDVVERYIAGKLAGVIYEHGREVGKGDPLSPRAINMTVTLLGAILERAVKRKLIDHNPARDRDLRVKERAPARSYLIRRADRRAAGCGRRAGPRGAGAGEAHRAPRDDRDADLRRVEDRGAAGAALA